MLHRGARSFDAATDPGNQCHAGAFGRARHRGGARGRDGIKELLKIIASEADARLPVDARADSCRAGGGASGDADADRIDRETHHGAAPLERGEQAAQEHPRNWSYRSHRDRSDRPRSEGFLDRVVTLAAWIGLVRRRKLDWRRTEARADLETGRSLFATNSGGRSLRSVADTRAISRISILGSQSFSNANRSRWSRWRLLTRWRVSPGRCWPRATPIGILRLRPRRKECGDGRMRLRLCVHELQG